jgi:hypothetical protein
MNASEPLMKCRNDCLQTSKLDDYGVFRISSRATSLLLEWRPALRWHELNLGFCMERGKQYC